MQQLCSESIPLNPSEGGMVKKDENSLKSKKKNPSVIKIIMYLISIQESKNLYVQK